MPVPNEELIHNAFCGGVARLLIYKYVSKEGLMRYLDSQAFRLTPPEQFNDPFEWRPQVVKRVITDRVPSFDGQLVTAMLRQRAVESGAERKNIEYERSQRELSLEFERALSTVREQDSPRFEQEKPAPCIDRQQDLTYSVDPALRGEQDPPKVEEETSASITSLRHSLDQASRAETIELIRHYGDVSGGEQMSQNAGLLTSTLPKSIDISQYAHRTSLGREAQVVDYRNLTSLDHLRSIFGVTCFSRAVCSILMWSHYSANHSGAVLCFEGEHSALMRTSRECADDHVASLCGGGGLHEVQYSNVLPIVNIGTWTPEQIFLALARTKAQCWAYEEELRLIASFESADHILETAEGSKIYLVTVPFDALRCVVLGCNMSESTKHEMVDRATSAGCPKHVRFFESRIAGDTFALSYEDRIGRRPSSTTV